MSLTIDGSSLVFDGVLTVTNFTQPTTGVCTLILTPAGGVGTLPALVAGTPGLPALITSLTVNTLSPGSSATGSLTQTSAGGAGVSSEYTLTLGIPQGAQGTSGGTTIGSATDLSGTAAVGNIPTVASIGPTAFEYMAFPWANAYNPTSITSASSSGQTTQTLCSVSVPAQASAWFPMCFAKATSVGTANTIINLQATLTTTTGDVLAFDGGLSGVATQKLNALPAFGGALVSAYGQVAANTSAVIYLTVQQTASTADAWSVNNSTVSFTVGVLPVS